MNKREKKQPHKDVDFVIPVDVLPIVVATSEESTRYAIQSVKVTRTNGACTAVATDGRCLLSMDWQTKEEGNGEVLIPRDVFKGKLHLFVTDKKKTVEVRQAGKETRVFEKPEDKHFPMWKDLVPSKEENSLEIYVDPKLLGNLLLAMAKAQRNSYPIRVSLFLNPTHPERPILLEAEAGQTKLTGVLMQCNKA